MIVSRRAVVAAALALLPVRAFPQAAKVSRIGLVTIGAPESTVLSPAMAKEFAKLGYVEGQNVEFERQVCGFCPLQDAIGESGCALKDRAHVRPVGQ